jgi:hypothetical protein
MLGGAAYVAIGWFLKWLAGQFRIRRERRAAIGRALSILLELRHRIVAAEMVV